MQTTGLFETHVYDVRRTAYGTTSQVIPFGDVHRNAPLHAHDRWLEFLAWAKKAKHTHFLGMGDYLDIASASERRILGNDDLHESTKDTLEKLYLEETTRFAREISFMRGKLIGLIEGNHYAVFQNGTTTTQKLCELLGCKYLGVAALIRLKFTRTGILDVWAHHGKGAARLLGGSLSRVQQMAEGAEADIYLMGHDHKKSIGTTPRLRLVPWKGGVKVSHRQILFGRTGSFLKGYEAGRRSYIADGAMSPSDLGVIAIRLTPKRLSAGKSEESYIDIHASL